MEKSHPNAGVSQGRQSINIKGMKIVYVAFGKKELSPGGPFVLALTLNQAPHAPLISGPGTPFKSFRHTTPCLTCGFSP